MTHFCRLCAELKNPSELTTTINDHNLRISEKLIWCCQWNPLNEADDLPQDVCSDCFENLEKCWRFATRIQLAQKTLREICLAENNKDNQSTRRIKHTNNKIKAKTIDALKFNNMGTVTEAYFSHKVEPGVLNIFNPIRIRNFAKEKKLEQLQVRAADTFPNSKTAANNDDIRITRCIKTGFSKTKATAAKASNAEGITEEFISHKVGPDILINSNMIKVLDFAKDNEAEHPQVSAVNISQILKTGANNIVISDDEEIMVADNTLILNIGTNKEISSDDDADEIKKYNRSNEVLVEATKNDKTHITDNFLKDLSKEYCNADGTITDEGVAKLNAHSWNDYRFKCLKCKKVSNGFVAFRSHIESIHSNEPPTSRYTCPDCPSKFVRFALFANHFGNMHRPNLKYCCFICSKFFWDVPLMKYHIYKHEDRTCICDICGKSYKQKGALVSHMNSHINHKPFSCDLCDKKFISGSHLKRHIAIHMDLRNYVCDTCGKGFRSKSHLIAHTRIHSGALPFSCEICGKKFRTNGAVTIHRRIHTGERPYSCNDCNHKFSNWCNYNKHMKRIHGTDMCQRKMKRKYDRPA